MIKVYIPQNTNFNYKQCKKLYKKNQQLIGDNEEFRNVVKNTFFYSFFKDNVHIGCIYYYYRNEKLFVNAFSNRHNHITNIECFKKSLEWFNCDIYAESNQKTAILCLLRCGFKRIKKNLYKYER